MEILWGIVLVVLAGLCWGGQLISWIAPDSAVRWSLTEDEGFVEPAFHADVRAEAAWDSLTLWVAIVAGVLLIVRNDAWAYFGLAGGAVYFYFAGRGLLARQAMRRRGLRIGDAASVRAAMVMLPTWGLMGAVTVVAATISLAS